jgi:MoxR-like ATPase
VLTEVLERLLIWLQCYEGLDVASTSYEWNYAQQILQIRIWEAEEQLATIECIQPALHTVKDIFTPQFLLKRQFLQAIDQADGPLVLLIDELDRAEEEFEAFLLELLALDGRELGETSTNDTLGALLKYNDDLRKVFRRQCLLWIIFLPVHNLASV